MEEKTEKTMTGKVYLVGAGPGDPGLLTLKGREALEAADSVVYDRLVNPALLDFAPPFAERICVGKSAGKHYPRQEAINDLLVAHARAGEVVVRLKGGDPFLFGRGGEEAEALAEAGIPWEVVPGVSSALAVPAYAGIPVTHRNLASSFLVATAHEKEGRPRSRIKWEKIATAADTLVFLMGCARLPEITSLLMEHGRTADTPAAVIEWGTYQEQRVELGTLENIAQRAKAAGLGPPSVLVVGAVVSLAEKLRWFSPACESLSSVS